MPPEIWDAVKKVVTGLAVLLIGALALGAYARMEQVPANTKAIKLNSEEIAEVKADVKELKATIEQGNRQVVLEIRKLGKAMKTREQE